MAAYLLSFSQTPDFTDEETKAQGGKGSLPRSHRGLVGSAWPLSLRLVLPLPVLLEPSCVPGTVCGIQGKVGL